MLDIFKEIINATYDKVTFIGGLFFVMVSVFCSRPVALWKIKLPAIDRIGRSISGAIGILLLIISLFVWFSMAKVGLFSTPKPTVGQGSHLFQLIKNAYAQEGNEFTIQQYRPVRAIIARGETIGLYTDDIKRAEPSRLVLFKARHLTNNSIWNEKIKYAELINKIGRENVIFENYVTNKGRYEFLLENKRYSLHVIEIYWYLFGSDYIVVEIKG